MKNTFRYLALVVAIVMVLLALPVSAAEKVYVFDATADLEPMAAGDKADGDTMTVGTDNYFTIHFSAKTKIDSSEKEWEDGYTATQRLNFGGKTNIGDTTKNCVEITTSGPATVKVWWVEGGDDSRQIGIYDSEENIITQTNVEGLAKNDPCLSTLEIPAAGTYYIGNVINQNYFFKIEVVETVEEDSDEDPTEDSTEASTETPTEEQEPDRENPKAGDKIGLVALTLAVSAAAVVVLNRKKNEI